MWENYFKLIQLNSVKSKAISSVEQALIVCFYGMAAAR